MKSRYFGLALFSLGSLLASVWLACTDGETSVASNTDTSSNSGGSGGTGAQGTNQGSGGSNPSGGAAGAAGSGGGEVLVPLPGAETLNCRARAPTDAVPPLKLTEVASGFVDPLFLTYAPGDRSRLFVVEQAGRIQLVVDGVVASAPFLDIRERVERANNEQGLLGLAFHPDYAENGRFFVYYLARAGVNGVNAGDTIVAEFTVSSDPNLAELDSERVVLSVDQPWANHNGGMLAFGPDGFLYIGLGDGGSGGDPLGHGQNVDTLLGSMLRIDIDARDAGEYGIPEGNFAGGAPETWHYGLRNPWRFSFDACTGDLYIGDVGQDSWEEIDVVPSGQGHKNFGWNVREGMHCFGANSCASAGMLDPVVEYGRATGVSITGGYVYRGFALPGLLGTYFYADFGTGALFAFEYRNGQAENHRELTSELGTQGGAITSFGQDADGEVYLVRRYGVVERIEAD